METIPTPIVAYLLMLQKYIDDYQSKSMKAIAEDLKEEWEYDRYIVCVLLGEFINLDHRYDSFGGLLSPDSDYPPQTQEN